MFDKFDRLIKGDLRPHLKKDDELSEIKEFFSYKLLIDPETNAISFDGEYFELGLADGREIELTCDPDNVDNNKFKILPEDGLEELINLTPPPPDNKSLLYLQLINQETEIIKAKMLLFLKESEDLQKIELFAFKNTQLLKDLAKQLRLYVKKLPGEHGNLYIEDANHHITHVIEESIIELLLYMQEIFPNFVDSENYYHLKHNLFNFSRPSYATLTAYRFTRKRKGCEDFQSRFVEKYRKSHEKPVGKFLFNYYRDKFKELPNNQKILKYREELHYWKELLIADELTTVIIDRIINDPEFEKILIPLLENEIKFLSSSLELQTEIRGFNCKLLDHSLKKVHKQMIDKGFIKSELNDFLSIFSNDVIKDTKPIVWTIKYRGKGHKSALRDFLELIVGKENFDSLENKRKIKTFFTDGKSGMTLSKKKAPSNYYTDFKKIIESSKKNDDH